MNGYYLLQSALSFPYLTFHFSAQVLSDRYLPYHPCSPTNEQKASCLLSARSGDDKGNGGRGRGREGGKCVKGGPFHVTVAELAGCHSAQCKTGMACRTPDACFTEASKAKVWLGELGSEFCKSAPRVASVQILSLLALRVSVSMEHTSGLAYKARRSLSRCTLSFVCTVV